MSTKQMCVYRSKTCCRTLKHFDNVFATDGNNIVEVFESIKVNYVVTGVIIDHRYSKFNFCL